MLKKGTILNDKENRPVTLYVESITTNPTLPIPTLERISVLDVELTPQAAEELQEFLTEHVATGETVGAIRIRLTGRLVIH
jgi:hypothetical protein